jgi:hypothetical protein
MSIVMKSPSRTSRSTGHQGAEALAEVLQLRVDLVVADLDVVDRDLDAVRARERDLGPDVDLGGELELASGPASGPR